MKNTRQLSAWRPCRLPHKTSTPWLWQPHLLHFGLLLIFLSILGGQAWGNIHTWNGAGFDNYWTNAANWNGEAPAAGDDLVFWGDYFAGSQNSTNNFPDGTAFRSITFQVGTTNFVLNGNRIVFSDATHETALSSFSSGSNTIKLDIELGVNQTFETTDVGPLVVDGNINLNGHNLTNFTTADICIGGSISGTGDLIKTGTGRLLLDGRFNNTYDGVSRVVAGTLELNDIASATAMIPGDVVISPGATLRLGEGNQIADTANVTAEGTVSGATAINGLLDLNGFSEVIGSLTLSGGGDVATGAGTLSVWGDITASASGSLLRQNSASISGNLSLGSSMRSFEVADNSYVDYDLRVQAVVSGSGAAGITKTGAGTMTLEGANTYPGLTTLSDGRLHAANATCFGASTVGTVLNGGQLVITGPVISNESLTNVSASSIFEAGGQVTSRWSSNAVLNADLQVSVLTNATLILEGVISGTSGVIKTGPGTLAYSGSSDNLYSGNTVVNEGELDLDKADYTSAIPYRSLGLVIGDGSGVDTVKCLNHHQIWSVFTPVRINSSGVLDLNGHTDEAAPLTFNGGQITTGIGRFNLYGTVKVLTNASQAKIYGNAYLDGSVVITNAGHLSSPDLVINASISGSASGGLTKKGLGEVHLMASNSFSGPVTVDQGKLKVYDSYALGNTDTPATVNNGATLHISGNLAMGLKPLILNGPGWTGDSFRGALAASDGVSSWAGPITNASDSAIYVYQTRTLDLSGPISGPGELTKTGGGTNIFSGSTANTYAGTTRVNAGTLVLYKTASVKSVPGNLVIGDGSGSDVVMLGSNNQIADTADVFIQNGGLLECGTRYALVDTLHGTGTVNFGTGADLTIGGNNGTSAFDGSMTGIGNSAGYTLAKYGVGTFTMNGNASFSDGITRVFYGKLLANGSISSAVTVDSGAALGGSGTVGNITGNGEVSPGTSAGKLNSGNIAFGSAGSLAIELNGTTAGAGYDQLNVVGSVNLTGAALLPLTVGFLPAEGSQFVIVNNDGADAVTGTFDGLAEGAVVSDSTGKFSFRVSYTEGSGNDVVLTMTNQSPAAVAAVVLSGNGNGILETNECNLLSLMVTNLSAAAMSGLAATLQSLTPGVAVVQPYSSYPNIPSGASRTNDAFFQITTQPGFSGGGLVNLELELATTSHGTLKVPFSLASGVGAGSGICELCPDMTLNGSLGTASPQQTGRLYRNGVVADCAASKNCPDLQDSLARSYNAHTFRNGPSNACITVSLTGLGDDVFSAAYLGGFDPTSLCTYYLADYGSSTGSSSTPRAYSFNVAAHQVFVVTVNEITPGAGGEYTLSVTGCNCRPVLNVMRTDPSKVKLDWTTAAPGYNLEGTNRLNGVPWVAIPPNPPVVTGGKFTVTNTMNPTNFFYRLRKP